MQGKFLTNLLLSLLLNLLVKPTSLFLIDAEVQNRVGAEDYGLYFSLLNLSVLFNILIDLGINNYTMRTMARDPGVATKHIGRIVILRILLFFIYATFTLCLGFTAGFQGNELLMLSVLIFNQLLIMFTAYARSYFSGLHFFKIDALISVLDRFLLIVICGALLYSSILGAVFKIEWYIYAQTISYLITAFIAFFVLSRKIKIESFQFDLNFSISVIKESIPYATLILLMLIYTRSDSVILERLHQNGQFEAGVYAQGFRLLDALYMFGMVFVMLLFPMFSRILKQSKHEIIPLLQTSGNLLIGGCGVVVIALYFNAETVLGWIYDANISESSGSFRWLMLGFFSISFNFIFGTLLTANGNFKVLNNLAAFAAVFNVGLNIFVAPRYGAVGIAVVFFITQSLVSLAQLIISLKIIKLSPNTPFIWKHVTIFFIITMIGVFNSQGLVSFFTQLLCGGAMLLILKIINLKELKLAFLAPKETSNNI